MVGISGYTAATSTMKLMTVSCVTSAQDIKAPAKVSMVGFDDGLIAHFVHPHLTAVRYTIDIIIERATRLALTLSRNEQDEDETTIFSPTLVRRNFVERC
ncbi:substrate-binding domain-containing protein [Vibrio parahaemolyticus]|nr:hypothetical protein [Vibrio parahaemolyticus]EJE4163870.1 substrate-binding domain-containing protein [Vibrio parahaemolyticus]